MTPTATSVLQVGFGGFGPTHLEAWRRLRADVWIADPDPGPVFGDALVPELEPRCPVDILASQFAELLDHVAHRTTPEADVQRCGVDITVLLQAVARSARTNRPLKC
jgi:hypothetical protein